MTTTPSSRLRPTLLAILLPILGGCVETGDFGRVKQHSTWNAVLDATGSVAARARDEPLSPYGYTDDEQVLRGRAWRFLTPAHERAFFDRALAELAAKRVLPPDLMAADPTAYGRALMSDGSVSPSSRYRRVGEDAAADARLLPPLADIAGRVALADGVRLRTLDHARTVTALDIENARARVLENACLLAWVRAALRGRIEGYRHALEHLVIETPQADAVPAERSLAALSRARTVFDGIAPPPGLTAACTGSPPESAGIGPAPLVLKG